MRGQEQVTGAGRGNMAGPVYAIIDAHEEEASLDCGCRLVRRADDVVEWVPCRTHLRASDLAAEVRRLRRRLLAARKALRGLPCRS